MSWLASALKIVAEALGFASKRQDLNNAEDVKQAAKKGNEQAQLDKRTQHVADKDLQKTREDLGEN